MDRKTRVQYAALSLLFAVMVIRFGTVWFEPGNMPANFGSRPVVFDLLFFGVLSLVILHPVVMVAYGWVVTAFIRKDDTLTPPTLPERPLRVAIITTYVASSEPLSILSATLKSMKNVTDPEGWSHDVWVLDERVNQNDGRAVERLCRLMGVKYFTRQGKPEYNQVGTKFTPKSKGGNHNAWYDAHGFAEYDIVAQFDTDFIVRPNALLEILPHFGDPRLGWVGTPQIYANTHHFVARGAAEQTYVFYGAVQRGRSGSDMAQLIGANHTIRVAALRQCGGYDPHLTEDLATSIELHSLGWKSRYVPKPLAHGEGPTTLEAFFKQQFRWAKGCLDLLLTSSFRRVSRMPRLQALLYLWLQTYYFNGLFFGLGIVLMMLKFAFGWQSVRLDFWQFAGAYVPMMLAVEIMMLWVQRFNVRPDLESGLYLRARVLMVASMPVYLWAFCSALKDRGKHTEFEVTAKGGATATVTVAKKRKKAGIYSVHHLLIAACVAGLGVGLLLGNLDPVNAAWAVFIAFGLSVIAFKPEWFELKDEFAVQTRRFTRTLRNEARLMLRNKKEIGRFVGAELKKLTSVPQPPAVRHPRPSAADEYESLLFAKLDTWVLDDREVRP